MLINSASHRQLSRRALLGRAAMGFGAFALQALLDDHAYADEPLTKALGPFAPKPPHYKAKATSVIFLYMDSGVSQVDSFDPKPRLQQDNGKPFAMKPKDWQHYVGERARRGNKLPRGCRNVKKLLVEG